MGSRCEVNIWTETYVAVNGEQQYGYIPYWSGEDVDEAKEAFEKALTEFYNRPVQLLVRPEV